MPPFNLTNVSNLESVFGFHVRFFAGLWLFRAITCYNYNLVRNLSINYWSKGSGKWSHRVYPTIIFGWSCIPGTWSTAPVFWRISPSFGDKSPRVRNKSQKVKQKCRHPWVYELYQIINKLIIGKPKFQVEKQIGTAIGHLILCLQKLPQITSFHNSKRICEISVCIQKSWTGNWNFRIQGTDKTAFCTSQQQLTQAAKIPTLSRCWSIHPSETDFSNWIIPSSFWIKILINVFETTS